MLGTLLIQLALISSRADLENILCHRVVKFMDALAGVVPYNPYIDFGKGNRDLNGTGTLYFSSNLRMPRNCTVEHPARNRKTMYIPVVEDIVIFLDNGKWISLNDCEMNISIDVGKVGDEVSMNTTLLDLSKLGSVSINDAPDLEPAQISVLKDTLAKTVSSLCEQHLSYNFSLSSVVIDQKMAYSLLQQVFQVFLTVL